jgi:hypothetical protein
MATITQPEPQARAEIPNIVPFEITVELYDRIVEAGLLPPDRRIFLRNGRLCEKMAKTVAHGWVGASLNQAIVKALPNGWSLWPESTIVLNDRSAPLPDFSIIRCQDPSEFGYPPRYPGPNDVGILIEIDVTSLKTDLTETLETYARAHIPIYWVVDVAGKRILVHSEPVVIENQAQYAKVEIIGPGGNVPIVLDGIKVAEILFDSIMK